MSQDSHKIIAAVPGFSYYLNSHKHILRLYYIIEKGFPKSKFSNRRKIKASGIFFTEIIGNTRPSIKTERLVRERR